jgi:multiple sugar transport system permease protein
MAHAATPIPDGLAVSPHARRGGLKAGESRFGMFLLVPALAAFGLVVLWPFLRALSLSLYEYTLTTPAPVCVGLANFRATLADPPVQASFITTAIYVAITTAVSITLGLSWALILNQPFRGRAALRSVSLLPWIMPSTVTAFVWAWMFNARYGLINHLAREAGLIEHPVAWLSTPAGAMTAIIITKVWLSIPLFMAFFLAGLQNLDREQIEAACVDGASNWAVLRDHILPHLRPVMLLVVVLAIIGNLQQFDTIWALTGGARCARRACARSRSTAAPSSSGTSAWPPPSACSGSQRSCRPPTSASASS